MNINAKILRTLIIAVASALALVLYDRVHLIVAPLHLQRTLAVFIMHMIVCLPVVIVLLFLHGRKDFPRSLGLDGNFVKGLAFALISTLPLFAAFPVIGEFNVGLTWDKLVRSAFIAAFFEEVIFRGFIFGQLFRYCKIGFWWSVIIPSLLFGSIHLYQGNDPLSSLAAFGVTFIGGLFFSWIYVKWDFNLWCPVGLHFFMNMSWLLFTVEGNSVAAGGVVSNVFRILSVVVAIVLTNVYLRKRATADSV